MNDANMDDVNITHRERNLGAIVTELQEELKQFLNTRIQMLKSELHEGLAGLRVALPLAVLALVFAATSFLLISAAIVTLVASAFAGNPYAWFFGLIIVGVLWVVIGAVAGFFAINELRSKGIFPRRTLQVLKADKTWIESEARTKHGRAA